ncbi:MAG: AAA family ATPase [Fusobacteriaceae bacterium]
MKKYQIEKLIIENFKIFKDKVEINFENNQVIVLDGPNGYGKTSIFDAIEILLTGKTKGILDIEYKDAEKENIFLNDPSIPMKIMGTLKNNLNEKIIIVREIHEPNNKSKLSHTFKDIKTFICDNLDESNKKESNQDEINEILGERYFENLYHRMFYIPQEESLAFLKNNEKNRREIINNFFDIKKEEEERSYFFEIRSKLNQKKSEIEEERRLLEEELEKNIISKSLPSNYFKLLPNNEEWDKEEFDIKKYKFDLIASDLNDLKYLKENEEEYKNYLENKEIDKFDQNIIHLYINYFKSLPKYEEYTQEDEQVKALELILKGIEETNYNYLLNDSNFYEESEKFKNLKSFNKEIENLKRINTDLENQVLKVIQKRENLKESYLNLIGKKENDFNCPFCGNKYKYFSELEEAYKQQESYLNEILSEKNINLKLKSHPIDEYLEERRKNYEEKKKTLISKNSYIKLKEAKYQEKLLKKLENIFNKYEINFELNEKDIRKEFEKEIKEEFYFDLLQKHKKEVNSSINWNLLDEIIRKFELKNLDDLTLNKIEQKRQYLNYLRVSNELEEYQIKQKKLKQLKKEVNKIKKHYKNVDIIYMSYVRHIRKHSEKIIEKLEIPLYIYSGKLLQNYYGGLGIFIKEENHLDEQIRLKFVNDNSSKHDLMNKFSSGQLSALTLSLLFSINKVYNNTNLKTLFIDDPLQTMDDINMDSFVDILRREFNKNQIIISTHEERVSRYIRYKANKYGLKTSSINLKEMKR